MGLDRVDGARESATSQKRISSIPENIIFINKNTSEHEVYSKQLATSIRELKM